MRLHDSKTVFLVNVLAQACVSQVCLQRLGWEPELPLPLGKADLESVLKRCNPAPAEQALKGNV